MEWSIKLPNGAYLDTPIGFNLQFELNNQVFSTSDTSVLPGSFSFPIDVPLTPAMKTQLNFPNRVDNATRFSPIPGVWAYAGGVPMFYGTLKILEASDTSAKITLVSNPAAPLKEAKLPQLNLGGARAVEPLTIWPAHMENTVQYPEDYDYIFMPVLNENGRYWNFWNSETEEFIVDSSTVTPFVKLKYLLNQIFLLLGDWTFINDWQKDSLELGRLYVFNNVDARVLIDDSPAEIGLPDSFLLSKHLPDLQCTEFLKKLLAQWNLGLFANIFQKTIKIKALKDVLNAQTSHNWTKYALHGVKIMESGDVPGYYNYEQHNSVPAELISMEQGYFWDTFSEWIVQPGYTYLETVSSKYFSSILGHSTLLGYFHVGVRVGSGSDYNAGMDAIFDYLYQHRWRGDYTGLKLVDGSVEMQNTDYPTALMFYRGIQFAPIDSWNIPINGNSVWWDGGSPGDKVKLTTAGVGVVGEATQSLNWKGENGLYEVYHKRWSEMIRNCKPITQSFILPLTTLTSFSFEDKVRIGNMDYFIKRIRIQNLISGGRVRVEANLISVI